MRPTPGNKIDASPDGLVHEYMHNRGGLRRPGRGLFFKFPNSNTENLRYHLPALHTEILTLPTPDSLQISGYATLPV